MAKVTTYDDVVLSFKATFQDRFILNENLIYQFFIDALSEFELEIEDIGFDYDEKQFKTKLPQYTVKTLGLMMKVEYCKRELSRINKLANIVTKEISQTGTGDQKTNSRNEMLDELDRVEKLINKQKQHCFG